MTDLSDVLAPEAVAAGLSAANRKKLFQELGQIAARAYGLDPRAVSDTLAEREKQGSTGFGGGVAIPHGRIEGLQQMLGAFVRLERPVDFAAVDALPVDLVFMLLSPAGAGDEHLKALARVSRRLRDRGFAAKLRGAASPDAIYALLTGVEARDAA